MIPLTLRQALLDRLRPDHQSVDELFSGLDLTNATDLLAFLQAQHRGLCALQSAASHAPTCRVTDNLTEICQRISQDLVSLNATPAPAAGITRIRLHPLAIEYIFLGSRLGGRVLKRRWQAATDPQVLGASRMFDMPDPALPWRDFCVELSGIRAASGLGRQVIADARTAFRLFHAPDQPFVPFHTATQIEKDA